LGNAVVSINTDAAKAYPEKLRRSKYYDREKQKRPNIVEKDSEFWKSDETCIETMFEIQWNR
jgi:hypothetical protein